MNECGFNMGWTDIHQREKPPISTSHYYKDWSEKSASTIPTWFSNVDKPWFAKKLAQHDNFRSRQVLPVHVHASLNSLGWWFRHTPIQCADCRIVELNRNKKKEFKWQQLVLAASWSMSASKYPCQWCFWGNRICYQIPNSGQHLWSKATQQGRWPQKSVQVNTDMIRVQVPKISNLKWLADQCASSHK